jgi:hypothetical protein
MTGRNAQYIEHRAANATPDDNREILMEGDEAVYREYAYGKAEPAQQQEEQADEEKEERKLLTANGEYVETMNEADVLEKLKPIFYNNEADARLFLKEIAGMKPNTITDLVNKWVQDKRISDYGNSRKGDLWKILHDAKLYSRTIQNWNRRVY